jgi:HSP20 family protein
MTLIRRTNPFGELVSLRQAMDRLFEDSFVRPGPAYRTGEHQLALDIYSNGDALVVEAALPGIDPEDVDISVLGDTLTISASQHDEQTRDEDDYSYREIRRGSFSRTVTLPNGLRSEDATATFENGMLRLSIPRAEEAKPRQIRIAPRAVGGNGHRPSDGGQPDSPADSPAEPGS